MDCAITKTPWHSWCSGNLPKGCAQCVEGRKLVLFITGLCGQRCYYCPVSEKKFGQDVVFANEWRIADPENPNELFEEARLTEATGAGITGGDPLVKTERCATYIKLLKARYGKDFHIHLYTPLKLVTAERLETLYKAGLDEIRFHPNLDDDSLWERLKLATAYPWTRGLEIPAIPGYGDKIRKLIDYAADKVDFINLNELERSDTQTSHYKLDELGYKQKDEISYAIEGSAKLALELLPYAKSKNLRAHFCTAKLKDKIQMCRRLELRAKHAALPGDEQLPEGLLRRGCIYLPELAPGVGYKEKINDADKPTTIHRLQDAKALILARLGIEAFIDETKLRLIIPVKKAKQEHKKLKKLGLIPAIVEEYPTADALEITVDFL